ncbi:hypothetical protein PROFUN_01009 [Planoprotostelium fungivorum]|uniref:Uncharacterized protein n=1 Tax=Planoprotostelium fungivorum TaxID=1890364 RepID=A0A2P6N4F2_9EUKA|nr:hypothetical protein PROFUN_01009 [Planoprotostelium fungivorum]
MKSTSNADDAVHCVPSVPSIHTALARTFIQNQKALARLGVIVIVALAKKYRYASSLPQDGPCYEYLPSCVAKALRN